MKKYDVFDLSVVKVNRGNDTYQYFICKQDILTESYIEIFSNTEIEVTDSKNVEPLSKYYSIMGVINFKTGKHLMLTKGDLLKKYNSINYVNLLLEIDEEIVETELDSRNLFEESKTYKKR